MKRTVFISLLLFTVMLSISYSEDKQPETKSSAKQTAKHSDIGKKLDDLASFQHQHKKSIQSLSEKIDRQGKDQKTLSSNIKNTIDSIREFLDSTIDNLSTLQNKSEKELISLNNSVETLRADFFSAISHVEQQNVEALRNAQEQREIQINSMKEMIQSVKMTITADQSNQYSAISETITNLDQRITLLTEQLSKVSESVETKNNDNLLQTIDEKFTNYQESLKNIENTITTIVNNATAQLNTDMSNQIQSFKTDFSSLKQSIGNDLEQLNSQIVESKHEQQVELQSILKQLTQHINQHDQNISDYLVKAEESLDNTHLTWLLYSLIVVIIGLIIFIIWDRSSTVAPLLARIRRLEDNLVIEY